MFCFQILFLLPSTTPGPQKTPIRGNEHLKLQPRERNMPVSKYKFIKDGWGSRPLFQASYGLKMTPEDLEEGDSILEALMEAEEEDRADRQQAEEEKKKGMSRKRMGGVHEELINALERERQQQNAQRR
jgi:hypothetical protein